MMSLLFSTIQSSVFTLLQKSREGVFCEIWLNVPAEQEVVNSLDLPEGHILVLVSEGNLIRLALQVVEKL